MGLYVDEDAVCWFFVVDVVRVGTYDLVIVELAMNSIHHEVALREIRILEL